MSLYLLHKKCMYVSFPIVYRFALQNCTMDLQLISDKLFTPAGTCSSLFIRLRLAQRGQHAVQSRFAIDAKYATWNTSRRRRWPNVKQTKGHHLFYRKIKTICVANLFYCLQHVRDNGHVVNYSAPAWNTWIVCRPHYNQNNGHLRASCCAQIDTRIQKVIIIKIYKASPSIVLQE